ncbi:MAG TPA: diiron oxygenase [Candidatus Limnocylindria bacterium]|nr:diiron oxygenase [Candidatus Limnocylindria bacterium]
MTTTIEQANFEFAKRLIAVSDRDVERLRANFLDLAEDFDASTLGEHTLFPLEMTWFYGEPIWHEFTPEKRLMLNRLSFCQSYLSTGVAEIATNVLNLEAALATIIGDDPDLALYMAREVVEEIMHVRTFLCIIRKVCAYYGLTLDDLRAANPSLRMASHYVRGHSLLGWLRGDLHYYYFTRYALNVNQKTVERCAINEPGMHPAVRTILRNHAIDEARHMQMSRGTGLVALARMRNPVARTLACLGYATFAANIYIGRHRKDSRLPRETRTRTLELCGVPRARAVEAYRQWRDRVNQPVDPPLVRAGRSYYLRCNHGYIDDLAAPAWLKQRMKRIIDAGYADVAGPGAGGEIAPLEFDELRRAG